MQYDDDDDNDEENDVYKHQKPNVIRAAIKNGYSKVPSFVFSGILYAYIL